MGGEEPQEPLTFPDNLAQVTVVCPACRNVNRPARRNCTTCDGAGMVVKIVPKDELASIIDQNCEVWGEVDFGAGPVAVRCTGVGEHDEHMCVVELSEEDGG